jgi:hypothetical protein
VGDVRAGWGAGEVGHSVEGNVGAGGRGSRFEIVRWRG